MGNRMTERERMMVAVEACVSLKTVRKWDAGKPTTVVVDRAIKDALARLGIAPPEVDEAGEAT